MSTSSAARSAVPAAIVWRWARLPDLTAHDLYAVMVARQLVFAVEQRCAYLDADGFDIRAWHLLGWHGDGAHAELAAYLRVIDPGHKYAEPSIGRVLTSAAHRNTGLGRALMIAGMQRADHAFPGQAIRISAQHRLEPFYSSLGFRTVSAPYEEDGIPHVEMLRAAPC